MKAVWVRAIAAVVLFAVGWMCWSVGEFERRVTLAHRALATLQIEGRSGDYDDIEQSMSAVRRLPMVGDGMSSDVRQHRVAVDYWLASYDALAPRRDANDALLEADPVVLFVDANAAYRTIQKKHGDRTSVVRQLESLMAAYADVMKKSPSPDAAFNYEYVVRMRNLLVRGKPPGGIPVTTAFAPPPVDPLTLLVEPATSRRPPIVTMATAEATGGDLPAGRTILGDPGAPPAGSLNVFHVFVPKTSKERAKDTEDEGGKGGKRERKG